MISEDLETRAYEVFVYPNLALIDINCKKLDLKDETIERAKVLAARYIEKTYHRPPYSHIKFLLPAFVYIEALLNDDKRTQSEVAEAFGVTETVVRKWYAHIVKVMEIEIII